MKKNNLIGYITTSLVALSVLTGCAEQPYYDEAYSFDDHVWTEQDTASFVVPVDDTIQPFNFIMTLRTTTQYQYSNLWVYVVSEAPDSTKSKVAQRIPLAHPDGSWIGRVSGTIVESRLRFDSKPFPIKGDYTFKIVNASNHEKIEEVLDISLRVEKAK